MVLVAVQTVTVFGEIKELAKLLNLFFFFILDSIRNSKEIP